ncbi:hypothetical protein DFH07DRAFT_1059008 [Mycena maculata]|uniref:Uncharacterized protein n=1 Tax=Mycena maculata TaxID=230809 RepID=A0AAD7NL75_9AGAR|nr:hypothetical protein DFH07DRAFT_1059008 [Mycena maculata]
MKFSILPLAVASAGLLASASPMRVVIVSSGVQNTDAPVAHMEKPIFRVRPAAEATDGGVKQHTPCTGGRWRQKATSFSNAFKIALGFSVSDKKEVHVHHANHGWKHVQPLPFIGTPNANGVEAIEGEMQGGEKLRIMPMSAHPHLHGIHHHSKSGKHSFLMRVHFALMSLGPWEGRAVAFVLGCGIGVLLRMIWVMAVISYRVVRGQRPASEEEHEYTVVDLDAEEIFVAPPQYTYPVEKTEVVAVESN